MTDLLDVQVSATLKEPQADAVCVASLLTGTSWQECARTELREGSRPLALPYAFGAVQRVRFAVGALQCETTVEALVLARARATILPLESGGAPGGSLAVATCPAATGAHTLLARASAQDLRRVHTFSRNRPYAVIEAIAPGGAEIPVHKTEVIPHASSCTWAAFAVPAKSIESGDVGVAVYDSRAPEGADQLIGRARRPFREFAEAGAECTAIAREGKKAGSVRLLLRVTGDPTFLDYVHGGLGLALAAGIDFTVENGDAAGARWLHIDPVDGANPYWLALQAVAQRLEPYTAALPPLLYGAGILRGGQLADCLPLGDDFAQPRQPGAAGVTSAYRAFARRLQHGLFGLSPGSTRNLAPIVRAVTDAAVQDFAARRAYFVLLLLACAELSYVPALADAVKAASRAPLSIVIVNVGSDPILDLASLEQSGQRKIVRIVKLADYAGNQEAFVAAALAEIPTQVKEYCAIARVCPLQ
jgi:hypothetical protein